MNMDNWLIDDNGETWKWNWTELCGYHGDIKPLNPDTHDLDVCFQQLCLQVIHYQAFMFHIHESYILLYLLKHFLDSSFNLYCYNFCLLLWKKKHIFYSSFWL